MRKLLLPAALAAVLALSACSDKVSFETVEAQRATAIDNSGFNAQVYRNAYHPQLVIKARGDSSIDADCPQGDGWATIDLLDQKTGVKQVELKCSTYSASIACMSVEDFQKRYTDGKCDADIPMPIPHVVK